MTAGMAPEGGMGLFGMYSHGLIDVTDSSFTRYEQPNQQGVNFKNSSFDGCGTFWEKLHG